MKRIVLFLATNIAVLVVLSVIINVFGLGNFLTAEGIDPVGLLVFSAVVGFTGSIISLLVSKPMAKMTTGARVIDGSEGTTEYWLVQTVEKLARQANIGMPEVAVFEGAPNAFATGAFKNSSLVAVSSERQMISGLISTIGSGSSSLPAQSMTKTCFITPSCVAASPMPGASYMVASMSAASAARPRSPLRPGRRAYA